MMVPKARNTCHSYPENLAQEVFRMFTPLHDRVLVRRLDGGEETAGGQAIPDNAEEKPWEPACSLAVCNQAVPPQHRIQPEIAVTTFLGRQLLHAGDDGPIVPRERPVLLHRPRHPNEAANPPLAQTHLGHQEAHGFALPYGPDSGGKVIASRPPISRMDEVNRDHYIRAQTKRITVLESFRCTWLRLREEKRCRLLSYCGLQGGHAVNFRLEYSSSSVLVTFPQPLHVTDCALDEFLDFITGFCCCRISTEKKPPLLHDFDPCPRMTCQHLILDASQVWLLREQNGRLVVRGSATHFGSESFGRGPATVEIDRVIVQCSALTVSR